MYVKKVNKIKNKIIDSKLLYILSNLSVNINT